MSIYLHKTISTLKEKEIHNAIIQAYRDLIRDRYQYESLHAKHHLPPVFDAERIAGFRRYFLEYVYPDPAKRLELDEAFQSLDNYIKQPEKLLRLLTDSLTLVFKYGRYLPKILQAGLKALRSFRAGNHFEQTLIAQAIQLDKQPPFDRTDILTLLSKIPMQEVDNFVENNEGLFAVLHDRKLVGKIKEIVNHLIEKMKKRPNIYSPVEIRGLEIGRDIITEGDALFDELDVTAQQQVFEYAVKIEREFLENLSRD